METLKLYFMRWHFCVFGLHNFLYIIINKDDDYNDDDDDYDNDDDDDYDDDDGNDDDDDDNDDADVDDDDPFFSQTQYLKLQLVRINEQFGCIR